MATMTDPAAVMCRGMQLSGYSTRTREAYLREVRKLGEHFGRAPEELTNEQILEYLLFLKTELRLAPASVKMALSGIRFFLRHGAGRDPASLPYVRILVTRPLPDVLTLDEVARLIDCEHREHYRAFFWTVYSLGLRLAEALHLQPAHIDSERRLVHVHLGKGARDRYVPLPTRTLETLRAYWRTHRSPIWLFPGRPAQREHARAATVPMDRCSAQAALLAAVRRSGIRKRISMHSLRHTYATHLLEAGVTLPLIQRFLGHTCISTTMLYLHLTTRGQQYAYETIDRLMQ